MVLINQLRGATLANGEEAKAARVPEAEVEAAAVAEAEVAASIENDDKQSSTAMFICEFNFSSAFKRLFLHIYTKNGKKILRIEF